MQTWPVARRRAKVLMTTCRYRLTPTHDGVAAIDGAVQANSSVTSPVDDRRIVVRHSKRLTHQRSSLAVLAAVLVVALTPLVATPSGATGADAGLMHSAIKHAVAKKHVTITSRSSYKGIVTVFVTESNPTSGKQLVTYDVSGVQHHATFIFIHALGYLRGDPVALSQYLGISLDQAQTYAGQWIEFNRRSPDYAFITGGVSIASAMSEVALAGAITTTAPSVVGHVRVTTLKGVAGPNSFLPRIRETLSISAASPSLPVKEFAHGGGITQVLSFAHWGHATRVSAPVPSLLWVTSVPTTTTTTTTIPTTTPSG
jgi:hypothetical protein